MVFCQRNDRLVQIWVRNPIGDLRYLQTVLKNLKMRNIIHWATMKARQEVRVRDMGVRTQNYWEFNEGVIVHERTNLVKLGTNLHTGCSNSAPEFSITNSVIQRHTYFFRRLFQNSLGNSDTRTRWELAHKRLRFGTGAAYREALRISTHRRWFQLSKIMLLYSKVNH